MKKTILTNLRYIAFGLVLAIAASYAHATWSGPLTNTYSGPSASFPQGNVPELLSTASVQQIKAGGLSLGGWFSAEQNAVLENTVFFKGALRGGMPTDMQSTITFGAGRLTDVSVSGGLANSNFTMQSSQLISPSNAAVCANEVGTLVLCDEVISPPSGATSPVETIIAMYVEGREQSGTFQTVKSNATGVEYRIIMSSGSTAGTSPSIVIPHGPYIVLQSDVVCTQTGRLPESPSFGDTFSVSEGDYHIIRYDCADPLGGNAPSPMENPI